jgi:hypothetical protein
VSGVFGEKGGKKRKAGLSAFLFLNSLPYKPAKLTAKAAKNAFKTWRSWRLGGE